MPARSPAARDLGVARWLFTTAIFVAAMVAIGGITRLTRSGLSIVEWKPLLGALPPIGEPAWQAEFARYQATPEFRIVNAGMDLSGFKEIYWVEWIHRLVGRLTGVVFGLPLLWFWLRKRIDTRRALSLVGVFAAGGLQGALGWFMVKSGLVDEPHVSPYRLTAHLSMALVILAALVWAALETAYGRPQAEAAAPFSTLRRSAQGLLALLAVTIVWGGLMAGSHAGLAAPTFPTMNGAWIPDGLWTLSPAALNPIRNVTAIHFTHRMLAYAVLASTVALALVALRAQPPPRVRALAIALLALASVQVTLGAAVVLTAVNIGWASLHQVNASLLLGTLVALIHQLTPSKARACQAERFPV